jgi:hypothetical protein
VLSRAIGSIPADARGEPEGFFEQAQGGSGVSVAEVGTPKGRGAPATFGPPSCPYAPECVEDVFSEVR